MDKKIKALIFDFDGTLFDTNELIIQTFEHVLDKHFPGVYNRETILPFLGPTLIDTFTKVDATKTDQLVAEYREWNIANHDRLAKEFDGVSDTLLTLKEAGYQLAIVSTKKNDVVMRGVNLLQCGNIFDTIIGLDDVTNPKPDPEPIELALTRLSVSSDEAIMVGDNFHDIVGGQNAGTKTAAVAWSIKGEEFLQQFKPDYMLQHITDIIDIVEGVKL